MLYKSSKSLKFLNDEKSNLLNKNCNVEFCGFDSSIELIDSDIGEYGLFINCNKCDLHINFKNNN